MQTTLRNAASSGRKQQGDVMSSSLQNQTALVGRGHTLLPFHRSPRPAEEAT